MHANLVLTRHDLWPVSLWQVDLPNFGPFNDQMLSEIKRLEAAHPDGAHGRSNPTGWQSPKVLQVLPAFKTLISVAIDALANPLSQHFNWDISRGIVGVESWANVNPPGSLNRLHAHAGSLISGAYYLVTPENSGDISFYDTRQLFQEENEPPPLDPNRKHPAAPRRRVTPKPGMMLLFPGWLPHDVDVNRSNETRYSLSFNLNVHPKPPGS